MTNNGWTIRGFRSVAVFAVLLLAPISLVPAAPVIIYGGPTYDPTTDTGYYGEAQDMIGVNDDGTVVSVQAKHQLGDNLGFRAVRWGPGVPAAELDPLGIDSLGRTITRAQFISASGAAVGIARKYDNGTLRGTR